MHFNLSSWLVFKSPCNTANLAPIYLCSHANNTLDKPTPAFWVARRLLFEHALNLCTKATQPYGYPVTFCHGSSPVSDTHQPLTHRTIIAWCTGRTQVLTRKASWSLILRRFNQPYSEVESWVAIRCKDNGMRRTSFNRIPCSGAKPGLADNGKSEWWC